MSFTEVAARVWVRHDGSAPNVTVIGGDRGLVVLDPQADPGWVEEARALGGGAVLAVVTTHGHAAHTGGLGVLRATDPTIPIHAHEAAVAHLAVADGPAVQTFSTARALDLGDRSVELVHPGRGHSAGDLVVRVPDADVLVTGDLVVEGRPPSWGEDCFPLEWPATVDLLIGLTTPATVVVPGHGAAVDQAFVEAHREAIGTVAQTIHDLAARGVPVAQALVAAEWPFAQEALEHAVRRGYAQLPRAARQLPLA